MGGAATVAGELLRESSQAGPAAQGGPERLLGTLKTVLRPGAGHPTSTPSPGTPRSRADSPANRPDARFRPPSGPHPPFTPTGKLKAPLSLPYPSPPPALPGQIHGKSGHSASDGHSFRETGRSLSRGGETSRGRGA
ncbi:hypothetical protein TPA0908_20820 [Micromonospora sp. AKA38]|nr:hypothetical protein TPA0908_20820 [Micromonospora sp. AKA38]